MQYKTHQKPANGDIHSGKDLVRIVERFLEMRKSSSVLKRQMNCSSVRQMYEKCVILALEK